MIRLVTNPDNSVDLHLDAATAGPIAAALCVARPRGCVTAACAEVIRVTVHATAAEAVAEHEAIG